MAGGAGEPDGVALEDALLTRQFRVAAGEEVAGEHGDGGLRVGRDDLSAFDPEQDAVGGVVIGGGLDPRDHGGEEPEEPWLQQNRRRTGLCRCRT